MNSSMPHLSRPSPPLPSFALLAALLQAGTRSERVIACLADVGAAVLNGGVSTFLAVMLLALSKSYVFRVLFQQFFLTVVFGLAHGMVRGYKY